MDKMIAYCGAGCTECPTFIATQIDTDAARKKAADTLSENYGLTLSLEDINCDGCLSNSERLFSVCTICEVRKCGKEKNVKNCAYCAEYACQKLKDLHENLPAYAKANLEAIRKTL